ncbi:MAG: hypothetical protein H6Q14_2701 [Bacteroidetes bacterium]|jgi:hypothetical protein|nr:hypothetical protein [Bacteroidota bacterium]
MPFRENWKQDLFHRHFLPAYLSVINGKTPAYSEEEALLS